MYFWNDVHKKSNTDCVNIANNQAKLDMKLPISSWISFFSSESYLGCAGISTVEILYNIVYYDKALILP